MADEFLATGTFTYEDDGFNRTIEIPGLRELILNARGQGPASTPARGTGFVPVFDPNAEYISTTDVNVRRSPSSSGALLGFIPRGAAVEVLARANDNWYRVQYGNVVGYMSSAFVVAQDTLNPPEDATPRIVSTHMLNVRPSAGTNNNPIGVVGSGETVHVIEIVRGWARISWYGRDVFVDSRFLR
jgi:uncharacterized protein YgiM (DUF1202 family)